MGRLESIALHCGEEAWAEARGLEAALVLWIDQPEHRLRTACTDRPLGIDPERIRIADRTQPHPKSLGRDIRDARRQAVLGMEVAVAEMAVALALLEMESAAVGASPSPS